MTGFGDIIDQPLATGWLQSAMAQDKLPHGLIFAGPRGVGKSLAARVLATAFLCPHVKSAVACGKCESCRAMREEVHPDFHFIYRQLATVLDKNKSAGSITIDVIRRFMLQSEGLTSVMNHGKVFVIDEAEAMTLQAQNALLKTLEEPFPNTLVILITHQPQALLGTIRSRCQLVRFGALLVDRVESELIKRGKSSADAHDAAGLSQGSLGLALRWLEDGVVAAARELTSQLDHLTAESAGALPDWFDKTTKAYATLVQDRDKKLRRAQPDAADDDDGADRASTKTADQLKREMITILLELAANHMRNRLVRTADPGELQRLCDGIEAAADAAHLIGSNVTVLLVLEQFAARMSEALASEPAG